ncbi:MAG TPA: retropepsin-like aspartic protease [Terracidiphilus sp.]|nr:retropepsin-like aspartic protease [Terracidiphilus sp.]
MSLFKYFVVAAVAMGTVIAMRAETRCPGNAASIRPRFVEHSIVIVPVMVNDSGPYDFVLDTAAQMSTIEPSLADELHFKLEGTAGVTGAGFVTRASYARPGSLRTGAYEVSSPVVLVHPLGQIRISDSRVRGILGENFLEHFDLLIDYDHSIVCLDAAKALREKVKGERLTLVAAPHAASGMPFTEPLILPAELSGVSGRPVLLQIDSGINAALLFDAGIFGSARPAAAKSLRSHGTDGASHDYVVLAPQNIHVGPVRLEGVSFVAPDAKNSEVPRSGIDGVLPTGLFRSVFISYEGGFAVLASW